MNTGFSCELFDGKYAKSIQHQESLDRYIVTVGGHYGDMRYTRTFAVPDNQWDKNEDYAMLVNIARTLQACVYLGKFQFLLPVICPETIQSLDLDGRWYKKIWNGCGWTGTKKECVKNIVHDRLGFGCPECGTEVDVLPF